MNHLVGQFVSSCPNQVKFHGLHRQGFNQTDLHGSDLAISVIKGKFRKIAFFQLKRIVGDRVRLERTEVSDAMQSGFPRNCFFTLAADPSTFDFRLDAVEPRWQNWGDGRGGAAAATRTLDPAGWTGVRAWTRDWLACRVGAVSAENFENAEAAIIDPKLDGRRRWLPSLLVRVELPDEFDEYGWE